MGLEAQRQKAERVAQPGVPDRTPDGGVAGGDSDVHSAALRRVAVVGEENAVPDFELTSGLCHAPTLSVYDMVSSMKTTIDIAEPLLDKARRLAAERDTTLKAIVEDALRALLLNNDRRRQPFRLRDASVDGNGMQSGLSPGDWDTLRDLSYEGRGG